MTQLDNDKIIKLKVICFSLGCIIIFSIIFPIIFNYNTSFEKDITVKEKYIGRKGGSRGKSSNIYYVVASDDTTYEIVNMWWKLDFNELDDYAKLNVGSTYRVKGYGKRIPFLGMVHKIYDIGI